MPTVTSENKAEHDREFMEKRGQLKKEESKWFHGSLGELTGELRKGKGTLGEGFYLTSDETKAPFYPKIHAKIKKIDKPDIRVTRLHPKVKNTYELHDLPASAVDVEKLKQAGYDSVRYKHELNVFDPKNVVPHKERN